MQSRTRNQAMFTMSTVMYLFSVCQALPLQPTDKLVRVTLLESISDARGRREANANLPDHLTFGIPLHDKDVVLRLTRTSLLRAVTSDRPSTEDASEDLGNAAVYTDTSLGSAMIIKMEEGDYKLKGSLLHANQGWTVEPHKSYGNQSELGAAMHRISPMRIDDNISFIGDNVIDTTAQERRNQGASLEGHPPARGQHRRHRRGFVAHVIEVAMIVDYNDFAKWQKDVGDAKAIPEMRLWYTYVAESINIRFRSIQDADIAVNVTITVLKILTNAENSTFISAIQNETGEIDGMAGLSAFRKWYPAQPDIPASDHYMLFTGLDIVGASGIAFSGRMCTESSLSICENSFTGSVGGIAAHELGHSLSAEHDVNTKGPDACTDDDQFVMSTVFRTPVRADKTGNPWKFSPCSIRSFKSYLSGVSCTLAEIKSIESALPAAPVGQGAGEVLSRDSQCRMLFHDERSSFCQMIQENNGGMDSLCGGMFCSIPNSTSGSCLTMVPQEFTPCSTDMWCVAGECLHKTRENATRNATSALPATEMSKTSGSTTLILTTPTATNATLVPMTMSSTTTTSSTNASQATIETTNPTATMTSPTSTSPTTATASGTSTQLEPTKVTLDEATSMSPSPRTITASATSTQLEPTKVTLDEATSMKPSPRTITASATSTQLEPTKVTLDEATSMSPSPRTITASATSTQLEPTKVTLDEATSMKPSPRTITASATSTQLEPTKVTLDEATSMKPSPRTITASATSTQLEPTKVTLDEATSMKPSPRTITASATSTQLEPTKVTLDEATSMKPSPRTITASATSTQLEPTKVTLDEATSMNPSPRTITASGTSTQLEPTKVTLDEATSMNPSPRTITASGTSTQLEPTKVTLDEATSMKPSPRTTTASGTSTQLEPTKVTLDEATSMKPSPRTITASGTSTQPTKVTLDEATSMSPSPRTTTSPTEERRDILTSTTPQLNSSVPMNSDRNKTSEVNTFRQCLAPLYRKNLAEFWDCLVNLASDILHELVGIKLV